MGWRTILVGTAARLNIEHDSLIVEAAGHEKITLPLDDISALILESPAVTLSAALLYRVAQHDIFLLGCDEKHMPCYVGLPFAGHSRLPKIQKMQTDMKEPFRKRCWQSVVMAKINNQADALRLAGMNGSGELKQMAAEVQSGDSGYVEAKAARFYFHRMFGDEFTRVAESEDAVNSALNYGYAIMRGAVARALAAHGFLTAWGIHHCSELNQFNLADDFIEPFRPLVDLYVKKNIAGSPELTRQHRMELVELLTYDVLISGKAHPASYAAELSAASYLSACRDKEPKRLKLPALHPLRRHRYE